MLGAAVDAGEWERLIERALAAPTIPTTRWVVQAAATLPVHLTSRCSARRAAAIDEPFYTRDGLRADGARARHDLPRFAEAGRQRRPARRARGRARRPPAARAQELDAARRARRRRRASELARAIRSCAISTGPSACSSGTRRPIVPDGAAGDARDAARDASRRCATSCSPATGSATWSGGRRARGRARPAASRAEAAARGCGAHAIALPASLVAAFAESARNCLARLGGGAPNATSSRMFAKPFGRLLGAACASARRRWRVSDDLYDGLLDEHEPEMRRAAARPAAAARSGHRLRALVPEWAERDAPPRRRARRAAIFPIARSSSSAASCSPPWASTSSAAGWTARRIRSRSMAGDDDVRADDPRVPEDEPTARACSRRCTRAATRSTTRASASAARHAARGRAERGPARVAGPALGEPRRPQPRLFGSTLPKLRGAVPGKPLGARWQSVCSAVDAVAAEPEPRRRPTRSPTICTSSALRARARAAQSAISRVGDLPGAWGER